MDIRFVGWDAPKEPTHKARVSLITRHNGVTVRIDGRDLLTIRNKEKDIELHPCRALLEDDIVEQHGSSNYVNVWWGE